MYSSQVPVRERRTDERTGPVMRIFTITMRVHKSSCCCSRRYGSVIQSTNGVFRLFQARDRINRNLRGFRPDLPASAGLPSSPGRSQVKAPLSWAPGRVDQTKYCRLGRGGRVLGPPGRESSVYQIGCVDVRRRITTGKRCHCVPPARID